jgi:peptidoglycan/xylan/chitin deacetylase (PgdA/CDA1 family)
MQQGGIHLEIPRIYILKLLPVFLLCMIPAAFADTSGSIAVTLTYTNGDTADYWPVSFKIYQDSSQTPYKEIESITGNPFNIVSLPIGHQYKIVAYANSMYSSVTYVDLEQSHQDVTINLPLPGGMRINAFYNDGVTPIVNATVYVMSAQDNKTWGHSPTNVDGNSLRFWIEPTTVPDDHYIVNVHIGNHLVYSDSPIYLRPGISQEIKITTNWPPVVNSLVTAKVLNSQSHPVSSSDGKFSVSLFDSTGNKISESPVTSRGEAYFSNLKVGDYTFKVTNTTDNSAWATANITEDGLTTTFQIVQSAPASSSTGSSTSPANTPTPTVPPTVTPVSPTPKLPMPTCNCVAFRLDNVQDYWLDNVQIKVIDSFDSKDAGITIGTIGKAFGNDSKLVGYLKSKTQAGNMDIAINGWSFEDFTTFTKDQQSQILQESKAKISSVLDVTPTVFMPPYEKTDNDTFYAMAQNGIQVISSNSALKIPSDLAEKIHSYPANVFSGVLAQNTNQSMLDDKIISSIQDSMQNNGYAIVTISFQDYAQSNGTVKINTPDTEKIQNLQSLIDEIRNNGYRIVTINKMTDMFQVPSWANATQEWSQDKIPASEYLKTIKSMIQQNVIKGQAGSDLTTLPGWVKQDAKWNSIGLVSNDEFLRAIEYLVQSNIIR